MGKRKVTILQKSISHEVEIIKRVKYLLSSCYNVLSGTIILFSYTLLPLRHCLISLQKI